MSRYDIGQQQERMGMHSYGERKPMDILKRVYFNRLTPYFVGAVAGAGLIALVLYLLQ